MKKSAAISDCGAYRYALERLWGDGSRGTCTFIMLNPSTADANQYDPTIRRCLRFADDWGCQGLQVLNLFALRSTDPKALCSHPDPVGPENDDYLLAWTQDSEIVIAAWGVHGALKGRGEAVRRMIPKLHALKFTKDGHPSHPLYLPKTLTPIPFPKEPPHA